MLEVAGGDGDREGRVDVVVCWQGLVDVRFLFGLHGLEGGWSDRLVLGEVHEGEALVVAPRCAVSCKEEQRGERL